MALEVSTRDCSAVSDGDLEELAEMCAGHAKPFSVGFLSKQAETWVLMTQVMDGSKIIGFSFYSLERIGGTPGIILGATSIARTSRRSNAIKTLIDEQLSKALMAFPDEDILYGSCVADRSAMEFYKGFKDLIPRLDHKANGEERAWGRRLAAKYRIGASAYDQNSFTVKSPSQDSTVMLDHESLKLDKIDSKLDKLFDGVKDNGSLILFGWVMSDYLLKRVG